MATLFGRKKTLLLNNVVAICGAVLMLLSKMALSFEMIMVGRFLCGINAGVGLTVHTLYLLECAPKRLRGMVGVSVASFVSFGKFTGQLLGISELLGTEERWIWLLGVSGVAGLLQLLTLPFLPESPRYLLLERADKDGCEMALRRLWGAKNDPKPEMEEMLAEHAALKGVKIHRVMDLIFDISVRWQLLTIIVTFITLQLCGINAVYLYSFDVFQAAGIPKENVRYAAIGTGLCEISASLACVLFIESTGKRVLLFRGYLLMAAALALLTVTLYLQASVTWMPYCSLVLILIYIVVFSTGPGTSTHSRPYTRSVSDRCVCSSVVSTLSILSFTAAVTSPLPAEIFTQSYKPSAFAVGCTLNWVGLFLVGMLFPLIVKHLDYFCFLIFFAFCFFSGIFVWFSVPETKNKTVLEITEDFKKMHQKRSQQSKLYLDEIQTKL
ncbi:solute carrier family 2 member 11, like isoform X1 [Paramisgurnus dabryanus]|uniref:solute carrier family 2 member 11, like isoform X1 n=1 Tax=Paramisgurnus dabryanus TaxID=90735 RepID=UPI003CCF5DB5